MLEEIIVKSDHLGINERGEFAIFSVTLFSIIWKHLIYGKGFSIRILYFINCRDLELLQVFWAPNFCYQSYSAVK